MAPAWAPHPHPIMAEKNTRVAIVNRDKCKPKKCRQECKKSCPVVRMGEAASYELSLELQLVTS